MNKHTLRILLVGLMLLAVAVGLRIVNPYPIEVMRLKGLDYYQRKQDKVVSDNIVIVEIDEKALEKNGQWPWKRTELAGAIQKAMESGATGVVLPIIFAEPDRLGGDKEFIEMLGQSPVITGQSASLKGKGVPIPRGVATIGGNTDDWLFDYPAAIGPLKEIGEASTGVGMLLTAPELDGVVRRLPLMIQIEKEKYPTMPLEILRVFGDQPSFQIKVTESGVSAIRVPGTPPIKTDGNGRVWINFKYTFKSVPYTDDEWHVKDKIVVIALTAEGLANTVATPLGTAYGHELSLQTLQMLLDGNRLERPAEFDLYEIGIGIGAALILIGSITFLGYALNLGVYLIAVCLPVYYGFHLFNKGLLADYTWIVGTASLVWAGSLFMRFVMEFKLKQQIKKQFGTYLSPAMVEKLQKNPDLLKLGGESRELSIMFTDVRGFTAISEHYGKDVQGLTKIMNRYMTAMTQAILDNQGTLDKYIGDAQMAFWNAPLDDKDHALHAVETGLTMLGSLKAFNDEVTKEGIPAFGMGLGVNTGTVVVGNMGSTQRFDYTCLGDSVNLASRLEGQSKPYGVKFVIGPITQGYVKDVYPTLELDCIAVKGKKEGVKIYTVFEKGTRVYSKSHDSFMTYYRERNWGKARELGIDLKAHMDFLNDYYDMMLERIDDLEKADPGPSWDGVFRATSK
jgi:adenylate cyclase